LDSIRARHPGWPNTWRIQAIQPRRRTPEYQRQLDDLPPEGQLVVALAEESIVADIDRVHGRRELGNGLIVDLTSYAEFGVAITYRRLADGSVEFVAFLVSGLD
jgi:hypothetical protein